MNRPQKRKYKLLLKTGKHAQLRQIQNNCSAIPISTYWITNGMENSFFVHRCWEHKLVQALGRIIWEYLPKLTAKSL